MAECLTGSRFSVCLRHVGWCLSAITTHYAIESSTRTSRALSSAEGVTAAQPASMHMCANTSLGWHVMRTQKVTWPGRGQQLTWSCAQLAVVVPVERLAQGDIVQPLRALGGTCDITTSHIWAWLPCFCALSACQGWQASSCLSVAAWQAKHQITPWYP